MTEHPFAQYVRTLGKGKTGSRSLSRAEAQQAMQLILSGQAEEVQIGAFLMLLRVKEESAEELAGFVDACRSYIAATHRPIPNIDFDWSSYAGKRRQPLWFLLAALLLAQAGHRVYMHGSRGHTAGRHYSQDTLAELGIPAVESSQQATEQLERYNFAFMPLEVLCPPLQQLMDLRSLFGLRSPVHTLCRLLNPYAAHTTLQSVFHPAYASTHHAAAGLLGERHSLVFKGDAGEVEYRPQANLKVRLWRAGKAEQIEIPRRVDSVEDATVSAAALRACWESGVQQSYGVQAILGSTALALYAHGSVSTPEQGFEAAWAMWQSREDLYPAQGTTV